MSLYRDLHAHPELSIKEVQTPAMLAPEMRKPGFQGGRACRKTGLVAVMKNGPGPVAFDPRRHGRASGQGADRPSVRLRKSPASSPTGPRLRSCTPAATTPTSPLWLATGRRLAAMKDQWSGTLVMILQPGEERGHGRSGDARRRAVHPLPQARLFCSPSTTAPSLPAGVIGVTNGFVLANVDTVERRT